MTDKEQAVTHYMNNSGNGLPERLRPYAAYDDLTADDDWPADAATGLVSLAFLKAAIRRSAVFCCIMTLAGFLAGCGIYSIFPAAYKASTSLFLTYGPFENSPGAPADNLALAQTRTVAALARQKLGVRQDVSGVLAAYTVTIVSNRLLLITFTAPSAAQALSGANAVATEFLRFRAGQLEEAQQQVFAALEQQVSQARNRVSSLRTQISRVSGQPSSPAQQSRLNGLQAQLNDATTTLTSRQQAVSGNAATVQPATATAIKNSQVLDPAVLLPRSHLRHLLLYPSAGLVGGLATAIAIVLIRALMSDRLRRRDDVAEALGAPVKLSTGPLEPDRLRLTRRGRTVSRQAGIRRIAAHLGDAVPDNVRGMDALAVVAVDNAHAAALPLVSLAISSAQQGRRVVLADLASGAPAARLLGISGSGGAVVSAQNTGLAVAVPERADLVPAGPLRHASARNDDCSFTDAVATACAGADMLLTLITLDPSSGGDHLATWAADAVVVVTAGRSSWTRINAVGEMVRLSGTRLASAVLIGADKTDESLGVVSAQQAGPVAGATEQGLNSSGTDYRFVADEREGRHRPASSDRSRR